MTHTITRDGEDYELEIDYTIAPVIPAIPRGWDEPGEPASGGEVTILAAWFEGRVFALSDAEIEVLEEKIYHEGE